MRSTEPASGTRRCTPVQRRRDLPDGDGPGGLRPAAAFRSCTPLPADIRNAAFERRAWSSMKTRARLAQPRRRPGGLQDRDRSIAEMDISALLAVRREVLLHVDPVQRRAHSAVQRRTATSLVRRMVRAVLVILAEHVERLRDGNPAHRTATDRCTTRAANSRRCSAIQRHGEAQSEREAMARGWPSEEKLASSAGWPPAWRTRSTIHSAG